MKKKIAWLLGFLLVFSVLVFAEGSSDKRKTSTQVNNEKNEQVALLAQTAVDVPVVEFFLERKTVAKWFQTWDNDKVISYVYVFISGNPIGYYIVNGKPVSTRSYLTPEEKYYINGATLQTPSLDGTYGQDNVGWHFFDSSGVAVAIEGNTASIIYTNAPLPLKVPNLTGNQ
jgi:hypothetical protein